MLPPADSFRYEYMLPHQLRAVVARCPVALQPTGVSEWHGEHNALGLDALAATYMAERAIVRLGSGVVMPTNWVGTYGYENYPGTVCFDPETTQAVFRQYFQAMIKLGFRLPVILTGHWGPLQTGALRTAAREARAWAEARGISAIPLGWRIADVGPPYVGGHAKQTETSILLHIQEVVGRPLVDLTRFRQGPQDMTGEVYPEVAEAAERGPDVWTWDSDLTDETTCSAAIGAEYAARTEAGIVLEILEHLPEVDVRYEPPGGTPTLAEALGREI